MLFHTLGGSPPKHRQGEPGEGVKYTLYIFFFVILDGFDDKMKIFQEKTLMFLTLWQWFAKLGVTRIISGFDLGSMYFVVTITV